MLVILSKMIFCFAIRITTRSKSYNLKLKEYNFGLAQYFGAGIMACIRGSRIYDTPETKSMVQYWVQFYKVNYLVP